MKAATASAWSCFVAAVLQACAVAKLTPAGKPSTLYENDSFSMEVPVDAVVKAFHGMDSTVFLVLRGGRVDLHIEKSGDYRPTVECGNSRNVSVHGLSWSETKCQVQAQTCIARHAQALGGIQWLVYSCAGRANDLDVPEREMDTMKIK